MSKSPECVAEGGDNYPAYRTDPDEFQKIYRDFVRYCKAMSKIHLHKLFNARYINLQVSLIRKVDTCFS